MQDGTIEVHAAWDAHARVYVATSDDVPGLVTEAPTLEALEAKLVHMIPDLLELNGAGRAGGFRDVSLDLIAHHASTVRIRA